MERYEVTTADVGEVNEEFLLTIQTTEGVLQHFFMNREVAERMVRDLLDKMDIEA